MSEDRVITYPADALQRVADRLQEMDYSLSTEEAKEIAFDIVTDVTQAVDKLRASEGAGEVEKLKASLREFVEGEDTPCRYDHHGCCQEHGYFGEPGECHVREARELLGL